MRSYFDFEKFYLDKITCAPARELVWGRARSATGARSSLSPHTCRFRCALTARSWRSSRAPQLRLTYLDKKWTQCETSSVESHARERRGCFPAHSSGISDWRIGALRLDTQSRHSAFDLNFPSGPRSVTPGRHGHFARPPVRAPGEDRGTETERRAHWWTGAGVGPEGRADPEASEWVG